MERSSLKCTFIRYAERCGKKPVVVVENQFSAGSIHHYLFCHDCFEDRLIRLYDKERMVRRVFYFLDETEEWTFTLDARLDLF